MFIVKKISYWEVLNVMSLGEGEIIGLRNKIYFSCWIEN